MAAPSSDHGLPKGSIVLYAIGRTYLKVFGWDTEGELPKDSKGILIAAPHTSNWDLPFMLAVAWSYRLKLRWMGKHTLFEGWSAPFMRFLGGVPIDRRKAHGVVQQVIDHIDGSDEMILAIAPTGTRSSVPRWKSGFYHIANGAQVPILLGFLDFKRKVGGVGPGFVPTGDIKADMDKIRAFYEGMEGLHKRDVAIRLKEEDAIETSAPSDPEPSLRPEPVAPGAAIPAPAE